MQKPKLLSRLWRPDQLGRLTELDNYKLFVYRVFHAFEMPPATQYWQNSGFGSSKVESPVWNASATAWVTFISGKSVNQSFTLSFLDDSLLVSYLMLSVYFWKPSETRYVMENQVSVTSCEKFSAATKSVES